MRALILLYVWGLYIYIYILICMYYYIIIWWLPCYRHTCLNGSLRGITDHVLLCVMHIYLPNKRSSSSSQAFETATARITSLREWTDIYYRKNWHGCQSVFDKPTRWQTQIQTDQEQSSTIILRISSQGIQGIKPNTREWKQGHFSTSGSNYSVLLHIPKKCQVWIAYHVSSFLSKTWHVVVQNNS